jgi:hypothetical protein
MNVLFCCTDQCRLPTTQSPALHQVRNRIVKTRSKSHERSPLNVLLFPFSSSKKHEISHRYRGSPESGFKNASKSLRAVFTSGLFMKQNHISYTAAICAFAQLYIMTGLSYGKVIVDLNGPCHEFLSAFFILSYSLWP